MLKDYVSLHAPLQPPRSASSLKSQLNVKDADKDKLLKLNKEQGCKHHSTTVDEYNMVMLLGPNGVLMLVMYLAHFLASAILV